MMKSEDLLCHDSSNQFICRTAFSTAAVVVEDIGFR
jgi:hypothetical protein